MRLRTLCMALLLVFFLPVHGLAAPALSSTAEKKADLVQANGWLEIDAEAFEHNIQTVQKKLAPQTQLCAIMKADAYGCGISLLMPTILKLKVPAVGVGSNDELRVAREAGFTGRLIRIRLATPEEIENGLAYDVEELIGNMAQAEQAAQAASRKGKKLKVHIALNSSSMSRNGIDVSMVANKEDALRIVKNPALEVVGIMTHYPVGEKEAVLQALARFKKDAEWLIKEGNLDRKAITLHTANTFATLEVPEAHLDMVRPGRAIYGDMGPDDKEFKKVLSAFKSRVAAVNSYPKGSPVGYDGTHVLTRDSLLANIPMGYSDGYRRAFSNKAHVLINGERVPVVGNVSMNTFMVDVTDLKKAARPGDEVVLYGRQGDSQITQEELEDMNGDFLANIYTLWAQANYKVRKQ